MKRVPYKWGKYNLTVEGGKLPIRARIVEIPNEVGWKFILHKKSLDITGCGGWRVSELTTGIMLGMGMKYREAIKDAIQKLESQSITGMKTALKVAKRRCILNCGYYPINDENGAIGIKGE